MKQNNVLENTTLRNRGIHRISYRYLFEDGIDVICFAILPTLMDAFRYFRSLCIEDFENVGFNPAKVHLYHYIDDVPLKKIW